MKKKIIISSYDLSYGGIEKSLVNILNNIDLSKYDITLVLEKKQGVFLKQINNSIHIKTYTPNNCKIALFRKAINLIKQIIWSINYKNKYDCSICFATYSLSSNFIARTSSKRRLYWVHSNYVKSFDNDEKEIRLFFDNKHLNEYNNVVFVSNEAKEDLLKYYPSIETKSLVLNNIVDVDRIIKLSKEKIDYQFTKPTAIFIGRMGEKVKRVSEIIKIAKKRSDIDFLLIGDGPDYKKLKENSKELKNVDFLGPKENPYPYLKNASFLILTSKYEGFPVVFNEAIVLNIPILSTIDVSDDEIRIGNGFGIVANNIETQIDNIINYKSKKIDFNDINNRRIKKLEKLLENDNEE